MRQRDDMLMNLEEEKSKILDEVCALQTRLESQTRISGSLQYKLQMCNQALAHEESRRKLLEVQVSESKACYENVFVECQEAKSKIESLSVRRDDEIAHLRNLLGTKETLFKEAEYRREYLEQENQELRKSLKEFQEAQIKEAGSVSSLAKLRNKLKGLEQVHKDCLAKYNAQETEWSSQMKNIIADLNQCRSELECKDRQIQELQIDLENCHSSILQLKLQNEEMHVMLTVYKCGLSDAHSTKPVVEVELLNKEVQEKIVLLTEQLDQKNIALVKAHDMIEHEREIAVSLMRKVELLDPFEHKYLMTLKELENYKKMLEESSVQQ
ncbi:Basic helix-loop-helix (BHLH) DNA-binding superfamily protein, partial [Thalictrum thalictroides]